MKKMLLVLVLIALLLSLGIPIASAMDFDDPCAPGHANNGNARCFTTPPPGLQGNDHGNAGNNWVIP